MSSTICRVSIKERSFLKLFQYWPELFYSSIISPAFRVSHLALKHFIIYQQLTSFDKEIFFPHWFRNQCDPQGCKKEENKVKLRSTCSFLLFFSFSFFYRTSGYFRSSIKLSHHLYLNATWPVPVTGHARTGWYRQASSKDVKFNSSNIVFLRHVHPFRQILQQILLVLK